MPAHIPTWIYFVKAVIMFPEFMHTVGQRFVEGGKVLKTAQWDAKTVICVMLNMSKKFNPIWTADK